MTTAAPIRISVIGTAGRQVPEGHKLTRALFDKMVVAVEEQIRAIQPDLSMVHLVSGAAAFADAVAVVLYLTGRYHALTLYMPAQWDFKTSTYVESADKDDRWNPGRISNFYMQRFSQVMAGGTSKGARNMGEDITAAHKQGAHLDIGKNFHSRNTQVAQSDAVIALTWGQDVPDSKGTLDTWNKVPAGRVKVHIGLKTLISL